VKCGRHARLLDGHPDTEALLDPRGSTWWRFRRLSPRQERATRRVAEHEIEMS
jgi:hypothetical protein